MLGYSLSTGGCLNDNGGSIFLPLRAAKARGIPGARLPDDSRETGSEKCELETMSAGGWGAMGESEEFASCFLKNELRFCSSDIISTTSGSIDFAGARSDKRLDLPAESKMISRSKTNALRLTALRQVSIGAVIDIEGVGSWSIDL